MRIVQAILRRLAVISMGLSMSALAAAPGLAQDLRRVPREAVAEVIDEAEDDWGSEDRQRLLRLLALDPRVEVRRQVVDSLTLRPLGWDDVTAEMLARLAMDPNQGLREPVGRCLAAHLLRLRPLARTEVVAEWATDERADRRQVLAFALRRINDDGVGVRSAKELLAQDSSPAVRSALRRG
jgi:hypothetical protein